MDTKIQTSNSFRASRISNNAQFQADKTKPLAVRSAQDSTINWVCGKVQEKFYNLAEILCVNVENNTLIVLFRDLFSMKMYEAEANADNGGNFSISEC